ncbi:hypothetical protein KL918_000079 [Ogataea parapolymorpha]|nr:hypothetical protein KL918_000079 [Ogataea parapolymorpha]KAG7873163.1 hypothetical protein KL916_002464 [Ogataea parapolymorpha]
MWNICRIARTAAVGSRILRLRTPLISRIPCPQPAIRSANVFAVRPQSSTVKMEKPMLMLAFTCKKCHERSSHIISKQAYTSGTVLVQYLAFEDIPEKLRDLIGHHAKDAPQKPGPDTPLLKE